jgi:hypothetical protein
MKCRLDWELYGNCKGADGDTPPTATVSLPAVRHTSAEDVAALDARFP